MPKALPNTLMVRIRKKHNKLERIMKIARPIVVLNVSVVVVLPFMLGEIFLPNEMSGSPRLIICYFWVPMNSFYLGIMVSFSGYFYFSCLFIHIKQRFYLEKVSFL